MKTEEYLAELHSESLVGDFKTLVSSAYLKGYREGLKKSREIYIDGLRYYDLGLPSGTLWSEPVHVKHNFTYVTYDRANYVNVCDLNLPTLEDFKELQEHCHILADGRIVSKDVVIVGPNGGRIAIGTKDYPHSNYTMCYRQGEDVDASTNKFWLKSSIENNHAAVGLVNFNEKTICISSHFTGFKLPYILVKKI